MESSGNVKNGSSKTWTEALEAPQNAIAITGFCVDFPSAESPDAFWDLLISGRSAAKEFPADRLNHGAWHNADGSSQGSLRPDKSYFLNRDIAAFDAPFFSITAAEATAMDPQQRGVLETTYRALENAGITIPQISGTNASVFTGCFTADYLLLASKDPEKMSKYSATGFAGTMLSNRISTFFNLSGPSMTIDTACSSSLVALDIACQVLLRGESSLGIVTGCNLMYSLDLTIGLSNMGFLSPEGICHSFDERANGYARGEGFGALIIKPLSSALREGDTIRAVIRATGSNQNGRTSLAQPSKASQVRLIEDTYHRAQLDMSSTHFVEAHGTGTATGDPIEAMAIGEAFRRHRPKDSPLFIGASKANIGHLEGTSGIAGIVKTVLVLEKGLIPPIANLEKLNPGIDADFLNLEFPKACVRWPKEGLRRASVNSFGFGGTNSHAILDDAYHFLQTYGLQGHNFTAPSPPRDLEFQSIPLSFKYGLGDLQSGTPQIFLWSAADEQGVERLRLAYQSHIASITRQSESDDAYFKALSSTLCERRSLLSWRTFTIASSLKELYETISTLPAPIRPRQSPKLGFVFTGQGAQWNRMGNELLSYPIFSQSLQQAELYLRDLGCPSRLKETFFENSEYKFDIHDPQFSQPVCTALQVALVDFLRSINIKPSVVLGHSSGEIAAAYAANAISRESAWKLAYFRGVLSSTLSHSDESSGSMISVALSRDKASLYIDRVSQQAPSNVLCVACINSQSNVTISGSSFSVQRLKVALDEDGISNRVLAVPVAYHSPHMVKIASSYEQSIGSLTRGDEKNQSIPMISSVTGHFIVADELLRPSYWVDNMVSPVEFASAVKTCSTIPGATMSKKIDLSHRNAIQITDLLEIGPHSTLRSPIRETISAISRVREISYASVLIRHKSAIRTMMEAMGRLLCSGYPVDVASLNNPKGGTKNLPFTLPSLPQYPFDHSKTYWNESRVSRNIRFRKHGINCFLGAPVADWNPLEPRWRHFWSSSMTASCVWVRDHKINGDILFPAAGMLVMAIEAITQIVLESTPHINAYEITDAEFLSGLAIATEEEGVETHIRLRNSNGSLRNMDHAYEFLIFTHREESTTEICRGVIQAVCNDEESTEVDGGLESREARRNTIYQAKRTLDQCTKHASKRSLYSRLYKFGYHFGDIFRRIEDVHYDDAGQAVGTVSIYEDQGPWPAIIHPATLDGILQMMLPAATKGGNSEMPLMIPTRVDRLWLSSTGLLEAKSTSQLQVSVSLRSISARSNESSIYAIESETGSLMISAEGIIGTAVSDSKVHQESSEHARRLCFDIFSKPDVSLLRGQRLHKLLAFRQCDGPISSQVWHDIRSFIVALMREATKELKAADIPSCLPHLAKQLSWIRRHSESTMKPDHTLGELYDQIRQHGRLGEIYSIFGRHFIKILKGECDALELLSQNEILQDYYDITNDSFNFFRPLKRYLELLSHKDPTLKIMEVGAGTGSTTKRLLGSLTTTALQEYSVRYSQFDFTDISRSFLVKAEDQFNSYPKIRFGVFDAEQEPAVQGYEQRFYDVLIAANVLHATKALHGTLCSLRKALKKGGKLILIEITEPESLIAPIIFGCLPGWWQSTDSFRSQSPCATEQQWDEILYKTGFSGIDVVFHDYDTTDHFVSCIISTATEEFHPATTLSHSVRIVTGFDAVFETCLIQTVREQITSAEDVAVDTFQGAANAEHLSEQLAIIVYDRSWPKLDHLNEQQFSAFQSVINRSKAILWVSESSSMHDVCPQHTVANGLARTLRLERHGLIFTILTLSDDYQDMHGQNISQALRNVISGLETGIYEPELLASEGVLTIPRVYEDDKLNKIVHDMTIAQEQPTAFGGRNLNLRLRSAGLLESLHFEEAPDDATRLGPDDLEVEVRAIGVNFKDILVAMGHVKDNYFGTECSGTVLRAGSGCSAKPGNRVIVSHLGTFSRIIRCRQSAVEVMPEGMTFAEGASIPTNFITAYRALIDVARLAPDEKVLIHAGAGGTGQAAIQIAQHFGATVFVTVGSNSKKELLMQLYKIPSHQILFSRDLSFEKGIKRLTKGEGVDVVLNSLAGPSLLASWECVAPYGRFIEIGKRDIMSRRNLPMFQFAKNKTFSSIDIAAMGRERPDLINKCLREVLKLFSDGALRMVLPTKIFPIDQVESAFRYLQSGKNPGKVVVEVDPTIQVPALLKMKSECVFDNNSTYVIAGGLGGQGRSVARWIFSRGARHLLLLSRSGTNSATSARFMEEMTAAGAHILAPACDINDSAALQDVLDYCSHALPPIKGCFQASMVIKDVSFDKMSYQEWNSALRPKLTGSWNLHKLLPRDLDFFVFLSSLTGVIGSQVQANYAAGNTFEDALAYFRLSHGGKATSINLSAMESEGILADHRDVFDQIVNVKQLLPMSQPELFAILDQYCRSSAIRGQVVTGLQLPSTVAAKGAQEPAWMSQPMFRQLHQLTNESQSVVQSEDEITGGDNVYAAIQSKESVKEITCVLITAITNKLSKFLSVSPSSFDVSKPVHSYGIDSLIAMELRNWFLKVLKIEVSIFEILGGSSIQDLAKTVAYKSTSSGK